MSHPREFVLTLSCRDATGIVCAVSVLSGEFCAFLKGRAINIHHSFLSSFKGAKPYYQARAVRWHVEHRVLLNGHKTVVFS